MQVKKKEHFNEQTYSFCQSSGLGLFLDTSIMKRQIPLQIRMFSNFDIAIATFVDKIE